MRRLIAAALLTLLAASAVAAQGGRDEREIRELNAEYDRAVLRGDLAFFERVLADDYVYSGPDGKIKTRAEQLAELRRQAEKPAHRMTAVESEDVRVKVLGDMAFLTGGWSATAVGTESNPFEPHTDAGRYTSVLERRRGRWVFVAEHVTERPHTPEEMEPELLKASAAFDAALKAGDAAALGRLLAEDFISTNDGGRTRNKAEETAALTSPDLKLVSAEGSDKKLRIYRNTAVETGSFTAKGTYKGKPFAEAGRYTTTWVRRDGRWQIVADHGSLFPKTSASADQPRP